MSNEDTDMDSMITTANIVRRKKPESLQKFLIYATEKEDSNLNDLRNTRK